MEFSNLSNLQSVLVFVILILPGFISMRVYSLIRPGEEATLRDTIFEALAYGTINLGLMFWAILFFINTESYIWRTILMMITLVVAPIIWPFLLDKILEFLARRGFINYRYKTAWDDFFSRRKPCWVIVHMHDGSRIGGMYHSKSYATLYPTPGHIFLEELWEVDQSTGKIKGNEAVSQGIILKPEDYRFIEIKSYID